MAEQHHEIGGTYFTADGEKVYLEAITTDGKFVVQCIMRYTDYGDDFYEDVGPSKVVEKVFSEAPVAVLDERFAKAKQRLDEIEAQYQARYSEVISAESQIKARFAKFKKYAGLELLEDFIDGTITHFVVKDSSYSLSYKILIRDEVLKGGGSGGYDRDLKLLTLYGRSGGNLQWKVNRYYDGSGGDDKDIWPCNSEDHAKETLLAIRRDDLNTHFGFLDISRSHYFILSYEAAKEAGIDIRPEITAKYRECQQYFAVREEAAARDEIKKAEAKLAAALAKREVAL